MAVYDRWHRKPVADGKPCACEGDTCTCGRRPCRCGRGKNRLYASADHLKGSRWQVRWDDPASAARKQLTQSFELKDGDDPNIHAAAFDKLIQGKIVTKNYTDPRAGEVTLQAYGETWRLTRGHSDESAAKLAARLRNHVYEGEPGSGRAPRGALSIGQHSLATLAQRPTLCASWLTSLKKPLPAERSRHQVCDDVTALLDAAVEDGAIGRNPMRSKSVDRPGQDGPEALPFTREQLEAIEAELPPRLQVLPRLGAGTGAREMELAALGVHDFQFLGRNPRVRVERQLKKVDGEWAFAPLKNRKPHHVPLGSETARAVQLHLREHRALEVTFPWHEKGSRRHGEKVTVKLILLSASGSPLTGDLLRDTWGAAAAKAAGATERNGSGRLRVRGWNIHRMRHTYASAQLRAGVDVVRLASWMGDTVEVIVGTYAHLLPDDDGEAEGRAAVDEFWAVPGEGASGGDVKPGGESDTWAQVNGPRSGISQV